MKKQGILLVNLGSPDSTSEQDVRTYLREFLMDKYVIDAPYLIRKMIVEWFILPKRPRESAHAYSQIWWPEGSPLMVITERFRDQLQKRLENPVAIGMRYGKPSIRSGLQALVAQDCDEVLLVPLYPQYAMATVRTVVEKARADLHALCDPMEMKVLPVFFDDPLYIQALVHSAEPSLSQGFDHLLFSYHGVPERHLKKTDPTGKHCLKNAACCSMLSPAHLTCYRHQCMRTTQEFARAARLPEGKWSVSFQSRLGVDKWIGPATDEEIERLGREGVKKLLVICPAFVADCLETLEEIGIRGKEAFLAAGGEAFHMIPCLNDDKIWVEALATLITRELATEVVRPRQASELARV